MTNFDKYQSMMAGFKSPQLFVDFGWYALISAALERRTFFGPEHCPLYTNQYIILCGPPGVGKGLVIKQIYKMIYEIKKEQKVKVDDNVQPVDRQIIETLAKIDFHNAEKEQERGKSPTDGYERPLKINMAADCTTYEALVTAMARGLRRKDFRNFSKELNREFTDIYTYSATMFCLEDIASLLRKHVEDVVKFLEIGWDCGDYKKDTKTQSVDRVYRMCVNFFGGTTPSFMQRTFSDGLLNEGFSSRCVFIYSSKNRHNNADIPELTDEQKQYRVDIIEHVKKLTDIYGEVKLSPDAKVWRQKWWDDQQVTRVNTNEKLAHYNARKLVHATKMAAAIHFGESYDNFEISLKEFKKATAVLAEAEHYMHHALVYQTNNPLYRPGNKIIQFLEDYNKGEGASMNELRMKFWHDLEDKQISDVLEHYLAVGKLTTIQNGKGTKYSIVKEFRG